MATAIKDFRYCMVSGVVLLVAACTSGSEPLVERSINSASPTSDALESAKSRPVGFVRGYYESRDGGLFTACGETSRRRVTSIDPATAAALGQTIAAPEEPRFLMAEGNLGGRDEVEIGRFNMVSGDAWNCESRLSEIVLGARGIDPLWSLEVTPATATFVAGPTEVPEVHAVVDLSTASDSLVLKVDGKESEFSVQLRAGICPEALTDTSFGWSIVISAKEVSYEGCAWRGLAVP